MQISENNIVQFAVRVYLERRTTVQQLFIS